MPDKKIKYLRIGFLAVIIVCLAVLFVILKMNSRNQDANKFGQENMQAMMGGQVSFTEVDPVSKADHIWGDIDAPVQMIIYDDFECPFCLKFYSITKEISAEFGDQVAIIYRHNPLSYHAMAMTMAIAAECADEQGQFWQMYDKLFEANQNRKINSEQIKSDAESLGLDTGQFNQCLVEEKYRDKVVAQMIDGKSAGAIGTPTIFLNGKLLPGAVPFEDYIGRDGQFYQGMKSQINYELGITPASTSEAGRAN